MTTTTTPTSSACSSSSSSSSCNYYADTITEIPSPQVFHDTYIQKRRPVVIQGACPQVTPKLSALSSRLEHLVTIVGHDTMIQVNECNNNSNTNNNNTNNNISFSPRHSRVVEMKFGDFVEKLKATTATATGGPQEFQYYMTTQNLAVNEEGQPYLYTSPISELIQSGNMDSLRPLLLGNLVPMTYNLWIGGTTSNNKTSSSSSSGLHHDYHDNLYCLLQGNKTFRIAPPCSIVHALKTRGTLHTLHANGRIVYQEQVEEAGGNNMIRPDGALAKVERIMEVELQKQDIEARIEALLHENDDDDDEQRKLLEQELDAIENELLDLEMDNHHSDKKKEDKDNNKSDDDDDDNDARDTGVFGADDYNGDSSDDDNYYCGEPDPKRSKKLSSSKSNHEDSNNNNNTSDDNDDDNDSANDANDNNEEEEEEEDDDIGVPLNFVLEESDKVQFQTLEIKKGDLLYLPAGWFHEVFSKGNHDKDDDNENGNGIHVAFNYWMHPPDVDDDVDNTTLPGDTKSTSTTTISFDEPYKSQFWQRDYDSRGAETKMPC